MPSLLQIVAFIVVAIAASAYCVHSQRKATQKGEATLRELEETERGLD
jgi:archaellin